MKEESKFQPKDIVKPLEGRRSSNEYVLKNVKVAKVRRNISSYGGDMVEIEVIEGTINRSGYSPERKGALVCVYCNAFEKVIGYGQDNYDVC